MRVLSRFLSHMALWLSALGIVTMTLIMVWQVIGRYVLDNAPAWTEQAALFLMLWFVQFAAAAGVREGFHIRIALFDHSLQGWRRLANSVFCHLVVAGFGAAMVMGGAALIKATWSHDIPTLGLPRGLAYAPLAVSGALIVFFALEHIMAELRGERVEPLWN